MTELTTALRNQLSKTIISARSQAESGARAALQSLAVERHEPFSEMTPAQRQLRNRLRAHGRQLGDKRDRVRGDQSIDRLAHEVAYAHWHRMLFARFLAENHLLIHPEAGVSVSLEDIRELAHEANENPDAMAASFAQHNLPQIFRTDDPVLEVPMAPNVNQELVKLLDSLSSAVFTADDSLGWTYQYWQSEKKDEVNAAGDKIGADELPAVTQLFTEHYMVLFLYHNTIGAWHAGKVLAQNPELATTAATEDELRGACALKTDAGDEKWEYLRFVRELQEDDDSDKPSGPWQPAAGSFEGWPRAAKELRVLDPCCGSGHFLVVGFKVLVGLRMHEEGLELGDAISAVVTENLFGLELDQRCTQIAAFNVAMAAWKLMGKPIDLPQFNVACSGLSVGTSKNEWLALSGDDPRLKAGMENLYELFKNAPELGSLIDPTSLSSDMYQASFRELAPLLEAAGELELENLDKAEIAVAAKGMSDAAQILSGEYTLIITNVPYLGRSQQSSVLAAHSEKYHSAAKADLATCFIERSVSWTMPGGSAALVSPQNWLFLSSYKQLRKKLLTDLSFDFISRLGHGAFETIAGQVVNVALLVISNAKSRDSRFLSGIDASDAPTPELKSKYLRGISASCSPIPMSQVLQSNQLTNPDFRISLEDLGSTDLLSTIAFSHKGLSSNDDPVYVRFFWEAQEWDDGWEDLVTPVAQTTLWGGRTSKIFYENGEGTLRRFNAAQERDRGRDLQGKNAWGRPGVTVNLISTLSATIYSGNKFLASVSPVVPTNPNDLAAIWCYCSSPEFSMAVRRIDQKLAVTNATLVKVPFDRDKWKKVAEDKFPEGLPKPHSNDATQWIFHGHPAEAAPPFVLQVSVMRLLGYRWPAELETEIALADESREWAKRCEQLVEFSDDDGIVCLSAIRGESAADARLRKILSVAFGDTWSTNREIELLAAATGDKTLPNSLAIWLRDRFFEEHCKLFYNRPLVWHIWDGNRDGFNCLVNAHKLTGANGEGRKTLESITYSYLKDWIDKQREEQQQDVEGADAKLAHAIDLQRQLEKILEGEPPYDLFVRWKPLHEQAIGWEPNINDGVRLNIRPFIYAELRKGGKKGAGILRAKPNIKWGKDRGKEPESLRPKEDFPWFWGANGDSKEPTISRTDYTSEIAARSHFDGNRWNDLHYSRAVKSLARETYKKRESDS